MIRIGLFLADFCGRLHGMRMTFDPTSTQSYRGFLELRNTPVFHFVGNEAIIPDEYAGKFGVRTEQVDEKYRHLKVAFDYQVAIVRTAIKKRKYAIFADCGLGKTLMILEYAKHCHRVTKKKVLIKVVSVIHFLPYRNHL